MNGSGAAVALAPPRLSVVVPARNCVDHLRACLLALKASRYPDFEIVVVDDASTDPTPEAAAELGARVIRRAERGGPAAARNLGAREASGELLFFLDADVCVKPDTLDLVAASFAPDVDAVFGSYDPYPRAGNFLSQYRNLMHHFVHQEGRAEASTFWSGCGAIRRELFLEMGGFDAGYGRPSIEDIELGSRLRRAGRRVLLNKRIQVTHLKRWTLWSMLVTDVRDRALPWTQLVLREGEIPNDLNLKLAHRVSAALAFCLLGSLVVGAFYFRGLLLLPPIGVLAVLLIDYWSDPHRAPTASLAAGVCTLVAMIGAIGFYSKTWALVALALMLGIVLVNFRFYAFFARERHPLFAVLVVPLHVFYYIYSGLAFILGVGLHAARGVAGRNGRRCP